MSDGTKISITIAAALMQIRAGVGAFALTNDKSCAPDYAANTSSASQSASQAGIQAVSVGSAVSSFALAATWDAPDVPWQRYSSRSKLRQVGSD